MARRETGRCGKAEEDHCRTKPATERPAKTDAIADTANSEERTGCWAARSDQFSGDRPETDAVQPGETYDEPRRKSACCKSQSGWFTKCICWKKAPSSKSYRCETERNA